MSDTATRRRRFFHRVLFYLIGGAALLFLLAVVLLDVQQILTAKLPDPRPITRIIRLPQDGSQPKDPGFHWDDAGRKWFHHIDQGTTIMPYEWLIALEQPDVGVLHSPGLFLDPEYMSRFGFLPGERDSELNPGGSCRSAGRSPRLRRPDISPRQAGRLQRQALQRRRPDLRGLSYRATDLHSSPTATRSTS